jgi:hypothetical protein
MVDLEGVQEAVVKTLFRAYLTEGRDLGHTPALLDVAAGAGPDRGRAGEFAQGDERLAGILAAEGHEDCPGDRACRSSSLTARTRRFWRKRKNLQGEDFGETHDGRSAFVGEVAPEAIRQK